MAIKAVASQSLEQGLRPLNPARDLGQVADLIGTVFADELEAEGEAALRDLRTVGRLGPLLPLFVHAADGFHSLYTGFVWIEDDRIVGNVTVQYLDLYGQRWQIANVAVLPAYRARGIGRALMDAALAFISSRGGTWGILQVRADNQPARGLYERLGFEPVVEVSEMVLPRVPHALSPPPTPDLPLRRRHPSDAEQEYQLAVDCTPVLAQWWNPVRRGTYQRGWMSRLGETLARLIGQQQVIREGIYDDGRLWAAMTLHATRWGKRHRLRLMVHPQQRGQWEKGLVQRALSLLANYPRRPLVVHQPTYHEEAVEVLETHGFQAVRSLVTMRCRIHQTEPSSHHTRQVF